MNNEKLREVVGWKLVPVEPTNEMIRMAWKYGDHLKSDAPDPVYAYRAMLAAAPVPPAAQVDQEPFAWACWADGVKMEKKLAQLCSYEPLAYPHRIKLYAAPLASLLAIAQATLDAAIEIAKTSGDAECIAGMIELRRNPQAILDGMTK